MNAIKEITPLELKARLDAGEKPTLIDVREQDEIDEGMIDGAIHMALGTVPERLEELSKTDEIIFICRGGGRSNNACEYLQSLGYRGTVNMVGGMLAWNQLK